jgi:hypothetical protein
MLRTEDRSIFNPEENYAAISKDIISGKNPLFYVYTIIGNPEPEHPVTYTSLFPLPNGTIETYVNDTTTTEDDEDLRDICFKLQQISLTPAIKEEEVNLFSQISPQVHHKRQTNDYKTLIRKRLPFATFAFHTAQIDGIECFDYLSLAHVTSLPPTNALQILQTEIDILLKKHQVIQTSPIHLH